MRQDCGTSNDSKPRLAETAPALLCSGSCSLPALGWVGWLRLNGAPSRNCLTGVSGFAKRSLSFWSSFAPLWLPFSRMSHQSQRLYASFNRGCNPFARLKLIVNSKAEEVAVSWLGSGGGLLLSIYLCSSASMARSLSLCQDLLVLASIEDSWIVQRRLWMVERTMEYNCLEMCVVGVGFWL